MLGLIMLCYKAQIYLNNYKYLKPLKLLFSHWGQQFLILSPRNLSDKKSCQQFPPKTLQYLILTSYQVSSKIETQPPGSASGSMVAGTKTESSQFKLLIVPFPSISLVNSNFSLKTLSSVFLGGSKFFSLLCQIFPIGKLGTTTAFLTASYCVGT